MIRFAPYLNFRGTTRDAMTFYQSVLGGQLVMNTAADLGLKPGEHRDGLVMHAQLTTPTGMVLMAGDIHANDTDEPAAGNICTIMISGDEADVRTTWEQLISGGSVITAFGRAPWGDFFGSCTDRFGVPWLLNVN